MPPFAEVRRSAGAQRALAVLLFGASALSACATQPDLGPEPQVKPAASYAAAQSLAAPQADWPAQDWWRGYQDPQLASLIDEALSGAPDMKAAEARVRRAEALAGEARSALAPAFSLEVAANAAYVDLGEAGGEGLGGGQSVAFGFLRGGYDFDLWGGKRAALAAARGEAEASRADLAQAQLTLSTSVASAYADLIQLYEELDAANQAADVRRQTTGLLGQRQREGLENQGSVSQSQTGLSQAEADVAALDEAVALAKTRIAVLLGAGPDRGLSIQKPADAALKPFGLPGQLQAQLVGRRPDIVAARLRAEAASQRIKKAHAAFYPNINLSVMGAAALMNLANPADPILFGGAGPAISLPLFASGSLGNRYRGARADYDIAVADYDRTVARAFGEVAQVVASQKALTIRLDRTRASVTASENAYRVAGERYRGGLSSLLEVLRSEDALIVSRRSLAALETRSFLLDISLVRALGGGYAAQGKE